MNDVIVLLDSSDDEEVQILQTSDSSRLSGGGSKAWNEHIAASLAQQSQTAHLNEPPVDSDSDDSLEIIGMPLYVPRVSVGSAVDSSVNRPANPYTPSHVQQRPSSQQSNDDDSDDDNDFLTISPVFALKKSPPVNPYAQANQNKQPCSNERSVANAPPPNPYAREPQLVSQSCCGSDLDDDMMTEGPVFVPSSLTGTDSATAIADEETTRPSPTVPRMPLAQSPQFTHDGALLSLFPTLLSTAKTYEDLRPKFILAFWMFARKRVQHSYDRAKLDQVVKRIVLLALTPYPIRSLEEYCFSRGAGGGGGGGVDLPRRDRIKSQLSEGGLETIRISTETDGKYTSITEACLVAMLAQVERRLDQQQIDRRVLTCGNASVVAALLGEKEMWVSLQDLIPAIDALLKPTCPGRLTRARDQEHGAAYYIASTTRSAEFSQVTKLETAYKELQDTEGRIKRHQRCCRVQYKSQVQDTYEGICMGVDLREGGGGHNALHEMCNNLDRKHVPYFVANLNIGDYIFLTQKMGTHYLLPILVERKSIEDIALSIRDGRWKDQKRRMYIGQYVFEYEHSRIVYVIEGKPEKQQVTGGYIAHRMYNVDIDRLNAEIENLKSEGFEVLQTTSRENTMFELGRWVKSVVEDVKTGKIKASRYTYAQFKGEVKKIPANTDFSRLAKYAMETKVRAAKTATAASASQQPRLNVDLDSEDNDIEVLTALAPKRAHTNVYESDIEVVEPPSRVSHSKKPRANSKVPVKQSSPKKEKRDAGGNDMYEGWTMTQLQQKCGQVGLPKSGTIADLKAKLNGPHPPKVWLKRKKAKEYVPPRHNVASTAILVALYLHEKNAASDDPGMTKDELYVKSEELEIKKDPFSGGTTQTGPYHYDGWSSMKSLLHGDPPLVVRKNHRYKLSRCSELAGYPFAEDMHRWCHAHGNCPCGATNP